MAFLPKFRRYQAHFRAHKHCRNNRTELEKSESCGCFYCMAMFASTEVREWTDEGRSAFCPRCDIDSVIGSASGYPITKEFLERMHAYWFDSAIKR